MPSYYSKLWQVDTPGLVPLVTGASLDNYGLMKPGEGFDLVPYMAGGTNTRVVLVGGPRVDKHALWTQPQLCRLSSC
jgi:hypothetical protein